MHPALVVPIVPTGPYLKHRSALARGALGADIGEFGEYGEDHGACGHCERPPIASGPPKQVSTEIRHFLRTT